VLLEVVILLELLEHHPTMALERGAAAVVYLQLVPVMVVALAELLAAAAEEVAVPVAH
jgi:hypothetical protein